MSKLINYLSLTRVPFSFTQTLFIILGFLHAGGSDYFKLLLGVAALGPTLLYGGIYILNDLADLEHDKKHPAKKNRLLCTGCISKEWGLSIAIVLIILGLVAALIVGWEFAVISAIILVNNILYSFNPRLKDHLYLGVFSCALNYPLRFLAGVAIITQENVSLLPVLLFFVIALNGFSAYRIYTRESAGILWEGSLRLLVKATAVSAAALTLLIIGFEWHSVFIAAYMILFSEVNSRLVSRGVDFFRLLRIWRTKRENPKLLYYPFMALALATIVVYVALQTPIS